ncbi:unnamed protein product, partial [Coregonus sp. 'balchen']
MRRHRAERQPSVEAERREQVPGPCEPDNRWLRLGSTDLNTCPLLELRAGNNISRTFSMPIGRNASINSNFTLHDNNTWTSVIPFPVSEGLLTTCPDCLLSLERWAEDGKTYNSLPLYSRRRELTAAELDFYKKQVACLSLPPETFMDPQKELCPDTTSCFSYCLSALGSGCILLRVLTVLPGSKYCIPFLHSAWIEVSVPVGTQNNILDIAQFHGVGIPHQNASGIECFRINSNFTLHDNNTWTSVIPFPVSEVLLTTCPDCLLTLERWAEDGNTSLKLYSRRRELTAAELDFYKKQVDCLSLPPETFTDPQKELCPDTTPLLEDQIDKAVERAAFHHGCQGPSDLGSWDGPQRDRDVTIEESRDVTIELESLGLGLDHRETRDVTIELESLGLDHRESRDVTIELESLGLDHRESRDVTTELESLGLGLDHRETRDVTIELESLGLGLDHRETRDVTIELESLGLGLDHRESRDVTTELESLGLGLDHRETRDVTIALESLGLGLDHRETRDVTIEDTSLLGGEMMLWVASDTGEGGFRNTSKAWPDARLLIGFTSMSEKQFKLTDDQLVACFWFLPSNSQTTSLLCASGSYLQTPRRPACYMPLVLTFKLTDDQLL